MVLIAKAEKKVVLDHFTNNHVLLPQGKYQASLPRNADAPSLGESLSQALHRFYAKYNSITRKGTWQQFQDVVQEYIDLGHAELIPQAELQCPHSEQFYLPMHAVMKDSSSTTKLRVVFDASARTSSCFSLNDTLLVGPTLYPNITDILMRFRTFPVAISGDISKMYHASDLSPSDRDSHCFVWRTDTTSQPLDYRMMRVTFGVAALSIRCCESPSPDGSRLWP